MASSNFSLKKEESPVSEMTARPLSLLYLYTVPNDLLAKNTVPSISETDEGLSSHPLCPVKNIASFKTFLEAMRLSPPAADATIALFTGTLLSLSFCKQKIESPWSPRY